MNIVKNLKGGTVFIERKFLSVCKSEWEKGGGGGGLDQNLKGRYGRKYGRKEGGR